MIYSKVTKDEYHKMPSDQKLITLIIDNPNHRCFKCERFWEKYYDETSKFGDDVIRCYSIGDNFCDILNFKKPTSGMNVEKTFTDICCTDGVVTINCFCVTDCADFEEHKSHEIYNQYLKSDLWKSKRMEQLKKDGFRCQICGESKNLNVHHITYENVLNEQDGDLVTLCEKCHESIHKNDGYDFENYKCDVPDFVIKAEQLLILYKIRNPEYNLNYPDLESQYAKTLLDVIRGRSKERKFKEQIAYLISHNNVITITEQTATECKSYIQNYKSEKLIDEQHANGKGMTDNELRKVVASWRKKGKKI